MLVALTAHDKPDAGAIRAENRPAHLEYLSTHAAIVSQAGPLLNEAGDMIGSLIILDVEDMTKANAFAANDPYAQAGLFANVSLTQWKRVIG